MTVDLTAIDECDIDLLRSWRNDPKIYRWCRQVGPISDVEQRAWFNRQAGDATVSMFLVRDNGVPVGVAGLTSIDLLNRRAEFSLYISTKNQKKGIGRLALAALLDHGFGNLGLHQIWGESFDGNPAIPMIEAFGFRKDGTRRAFYWKDGAFHDAHLFSLLRDDWAQLSQ